MADKKKFCGIYTALITPFQRDGSIDKGALIELIAHGIGEGVDGFVICGTTGEAPSLSTDEKIELIKCAQKHSQGRPIIVGAGLNCTKKTIDLQIRLQDEGADATLQVTPYYNKPTQEGLQKHFLAVADRAKIPMILYNVPKRTGVNLLPKTAQKLFLQHEMIVGLKDANTDLAHMSEILKLCHDMRSDISILCGEDSAFFPYMTLGADGIISVCSHIAGHILVEIYKCVKNSQLAHAQKINHKLHDLCKLLSRHTNPIAIKSLLASMGQINNYLRLPLCPLSKKEEKDLIDDFNAVRKSF